MSAFPTDILAFAPPFLAVNNQTWISNHSEEREFFSVNEDSWAIRGGRLFAAKIRVNWEHINTLIRHSFQRLSSAAVARTETILQACKYVLIYGSHPTRLPRELCPNLEGRNQKLRFCPYSYSCVNNARGETIQYARRLRDHTELLMFSLLKTMSLNNNTSSAWIITNLFGVSWLFQFCYCLVWRKQHLQAFDLYSNG